MSRNSYNPVAVTSRLETESVLGPLPAGWEKIAYEGKPLFIDHNTSSTTWVDPRTHSRRKQTVKEVAAGELPYGWDEVYDKKVGIYYLDQITGAAYPAGPWDESVHDKVVDDYIKIATDPSTLQEYEILEKRKREEVARLSSKISQLDSLRGGEEQRLTDLEDHAAKNTVNVQEYNLKQAQFKEQIDKYKRDIQREKTSFDQVASEHALLLSELEQFKSVLHQLHKSSEGKGGSSGSLEDMDYATNAADIREMIEKQTFQRKALEKELQDLQSKLVPLLSPSQQSQIRKKEAEVNNNLTSSDEKDPHLPEPGSLNVTEELERLNAILAEEKAERHRLRDLKRTLEAERIRLEEVRKKNVLKFQTLLNCKSLRAMTHISRSGLLI